MNKRLKVVIAVVVAVIVVFCVYFALNTRGEVENNASNPSETNSKDSNGKPLAIEPEIKISDNFAIDNNMSKVISFQRTQSMLEVKTAKTSKNLLLYRQKTLPRGYMMCHLINNG